MPIRRADHAPAHSQSMTEMPATAPGLPSPTSPEDDRLSDLDTGPDQAPQKASDTSVGSPAESSAQAPAGLGESDRVALPGLRVVICEDEGVTQMQLRRALTRAGMAIAGIATNGQEAVEVVLRERPDLVLMDIRMPVMDGLEATRRILESFDTCVVMLTAFSSDSHQMQARDIGASGYVVKPITSDVLLPLIREALWRYRKGRPQPS